jgi:hypothetical protein
MDSQGTEGWRISEQKEGKDNLAITPDWVDLVSRDTSQIQIQHGG